MIIDLEGWEFDPLTFLLPKLYNIPNSDFSARQPRVPPVSQIIIPVDPRFFRPVQLVDDTERSWKRVVPGEPNLV